MISVLLQTLINSTKHLDKSFTYKFVLPWLGTGLLTSTGKRDTKICDKYEIRVSQFAECHDFFSRGMMTCNSVDKKQEYSGS